MSGREYYVRGRGYITTSPPSRTIALRARRRRHAGPGAGRRPRCASAPTSGAACSSWNGEGEAVGGVVVMRYGENALDVIERVKKQARRSCGPRFPAGVEVADRLRPLRPDRAIDRHAEACADRGGDHRQRWSSSSSCCTSAARCCRSCRCRSAWRCRSSPWRCSASRRPS